MTFATRRRLFYLLVLVFFVVSGAVILYAEGWRLNSKSLQFEKVGAIFVRSYPTDASLILSGEPVQNTTGFLSAGTLISNLFPTNYSLTLKKQGYLTWTENVNVSPSLVTELKYAVLVPQNATSVATSTVKSFFVAGGTAVYESPAGAVSWRGGTIGHGNIIAQSASLKNVILQNIATGVDTVYDLTDGTSISLGTLQHVAIDPYNAESAIAWNSQNIWTIDLNPGTAAATRIATASSRSTFGPSVAASPSFIAWSESQAAATSSRITVFDKFLRVTASTSSIPGTVVTLKWINDGQLAALTGTGSLYRYDTSAGSVQKIADDVKDFYPSSDGVAIAVLGYQSIEIIPVTGSNYYRFNIPNVGAIQNLTWYKDRSHLFIEYPDHVAFLDFADAGLRNVLNVAEGMSPFYDASSNSLYLIDTGKRLIQFTFPS